MKTGVNFLEHKRKNPNKNPNNKAVLSVSLWNLQLNAWTVCFSCPVNNLKYRTPESNGPYSHVEFFHKIQIYVTSNNVQEKELIFISRNLDYKHTTLQGAFQSQAIFLLQYAVCVLPNSDNGVYNAEQCQCQ